MKSFNTVLLLAASVFMAPVSAQDAAPVVAEATDAAAAAIGTPEPGKALVVFFRPSAFKGAAIGFIVREGETELGKLRNATYFVHPTTPGQHSYVVHSEAKDVMNIEVEAGETYYVSGSLSMGVFAGRPNLSPSSQDAFVAAQKKLKPAKPLKQKD